MIPRRHPRYESLKRREALVGGYEKGITVLQGLIAHGRGEAFDYLLGEKTIEPATEAIRASAALLLLAKDPVVSVNGNTAALCPKELVELANVVGAKLEINLFHRSDARIKRIIKVLLKHGAKQVLGFGGDARIKGLAGDRAKVDGAGIYAADVVLVSLEDGDRTEALVAMGKKVIAIDLNPLSRTARRATITIVDEVVRAVPALAKEAKALKKMSKAKLEELARFGNRQNLGEFLHHINKRLEELEISGEFSPEDSHLVSSR